MTHPRWLTASALVLVFALSKGVWAQEGAEPPTPEQLAASERIRPRIEALFADMRAPWNPDQDRSHYFVDTTDALISLGPDVVPFLSAEVELLDPQTYHYCAYALGRIGGAPAEVALRKAYRRAVERKGPLGAACERFALFGLAVLGKPDVVDLAQNGLPVQGLEQLPDLPLMTHLAMLTAPASVPYLQAQFAAFLTDPDAIEKLRWTVTALGRTGDTTLRAKIVPLLDHSSPVVRAAAADALSRFGGPGVCDLLLSRLGDPNVNVNYAIATGVERLKSETCLKTVVARLDVEKNFEVRSALYRTILAVAGEGALPALRDAWDHGGPHDRAVVAELLGRLGSRKGLTLLRSGIAGKEPDVVLSAVTALGRIGGAGAVDTLEALVADPRRNVALEAVGALTELGDSGASPRIAERLLSIVRLPVGDLTLRPVIRDLAESLVTLGFGAAREDIAKAAAVQSDIELKQILESCATRLELLQAAGENPVPWGEALASGDPAVRRLAAKRLAEIGTPPAVNVLRARFDRPDATVDDRAVVLRGIASGRAVAASDLIARVLGDPSLDSWTNDRVRQEAAWAARRIGGERMIKALRSSAERRDGRDFAVLAYLAVLDPAGSTELLRKLRITRVRYAEAAFGHQDFLLDAILSDTAAGRVPKTYDLPPDVLAEM